MHGLLCLQEKMLKQSAVRSKARAGGLFASHRGNSFQRREMEDDKVRRRKENLKIQFPPRKTYRDSSPENESWRTPLLGRARCAIFMQ